MVLIAIAWMYVVLMVAVVEASSPQGSLLGAMSTVVFYGLIPLGIVGYLFFSPARRRRRRALEAGQARAESAALDPDQRPHATGEPLAPEREEP